MTTRLCSSALITCVVFAALILSGGRPGMTNTTPRIMAQSWVAIPSAVPNAVLDGHAQPIGSVGADTSMVLGIGLPLRHEKRLDQFISQDAFHGRYLSKAQFDIEFAPTASHAARVAQWARANGLIVVSTSTDHSVIAVRARASRIQTVLHVKIRRYDIHGAVRYADATPPLVPGYLGIQSITGLDNIRRAVQVGLQRVHSRGAFIPSGGLTPQTLADAYNSAGYSVDGTPVDGTGQDVGVTLFGEPVPDSDFQLFAEHVGGPEICTTCADKLVWHQLIKKVTGDPDIDEQALDVEYVHGMAPHARVDYWLGADGTDAGMEEAIADAASDPNIHVVSNSWGDPGPESASANNSFVKATTNSFKEAVATGTTFYFSSGDTAAQSGCAQKRKKARTCELPSYPADSPYVVAVGGTNLQLSKGLNSWQSEATWNWDASGEGSGGGCAPFLPRPAWQTHVAGIATCSGRAIPDISAVADPENSPVDVWDDGSSLEIGGTSVAAQIVAGLALDTNSYLTLEHAVDPSVPASGGSATCSTTSSTFCWMGFAGPEIYQIAGSSDFNTDFHDVLCGSNTWPAQVGWDQATGWGSINWHSFTQSYAGQPVTPVAPATSWLCTPSTQSQEDLKAVYCGPTYNCHAAGQSGVVLSTLDGWHWHKSVTSSTAQTITGLVCPDADTCYATTAKGSVLKSTNAGKSFVAYKSGLRSAVGISCISKVWCVVVGAGISLTKNGKQFVNESNPLPGKPLVGVSCVTDYCAAVTAQSGVISSTNGSDWTVPAGSTPASGNLTSISCRAPGHCQAVGRSAQANSDGGTALVYSTTDGVHWSPQTQAGDYGGLDSVSCASSTVCDAIAARGVILRTVDGATWQAIPTQPVGATLNAISCPSLEICYAVGNDGRDVQIGAEPGF